MGFFKRFTRPRAKIWLTTEKHELSLGEELKGLVGVVSEEEFDIERITVSFSCWESIKKTRRYYRTDYERKATGEPLEEKKELVEEEYWDEEKLYSERLIICSGFHVSIGFKHIKPHEGFPFVFKIPVSERETYHGADRKVKWFVTPYMHIKGRRPIFQRYEILVAKPSVSLKEIVREVVLIPCAYCGGLMPQTSTFCPNCGAGRKS